MLGAWSKDYVNFMTGWSAGFARGWPSNLRDVCPNVTDQ